MAGGELSPKYDIQASSGVKGTAQPAAIGSSVFRIKWPEHEIDHSLLLNSRTGEVYLITERCLNVSVKFNRNSLRDFSKRSPLSNRRTQYVGYNFSLLFI